MGKSCIYFLLISVYTVYVSAYIFEECPQSCECDGNDLKCINKSLSSLNYISIKNIVSIFFYIKLSTWGCVTHPYNKN